MRKKQKKSGPLALPNLLLAALLLGCTAAPEPGNDAPPSPLPVTPSDATPATATQPAPPTPSTEETMTPAASPPPGTNRFVDEAIEDLARRLGVPAAEVELIIFEAVVWPDGSLGCPEPGMAYTQVLVEGYRILLSHGGDGYAYHGSGAGGPFLCENPDSPSTLPPGSGDS